MNDKWQTATGLILALGLLLASPIWSGPRRAAVAAGGITVGKNQTDHSFAQQVTFTLQAASDAEITQVYLFFRATEDERTESVDVAFEPAHEIAIDYVHDLRLSPLPPFATVTYWWQIDDAADNRLTTEPQEFKYTDNRFYWEQLSAGEFTVHWIEGHGDTIFGQAALDISQASLVKIDAELQSSTPEPIDIYIYDSQSNLEAAMTLSGRNWVAGQARPELGVIVITILPGEGYTSAMRRYIPHEITHLLVYRMVAPANYRYVPEWLDEGLATANEQLPTPEYALVLEEARLQQRLLPLEDLCVPFSPDSQDAYLSYAQSNSVVQYIREQYGAPAIRGLLTTYADGASCTGGVQNALGISLDSLETDWRASLEPPAPWQAWVRQTGIWIGLWLLSMLIAIPMIGGLRRRRQ